MDWTPLTVTCGVPTPAPAPAPQARSATGPHQLQLPCTTKGCWGLLAPVGGRRAVRGW